MVLMLSERSIMISLHDKLNDKTKPLMDRIHDVNKYVDVAVNNKEKFLETSNE